MAAGKGNLHTSLVGRYAVPAKNALERDAQNRQARLPMPEFWPLKPNLSGQHFAEIVGAWLEEHSVRLQVLGPMGDTARIWLHDGLIDIYKSPGEVPWDNYK